MDNKLKDTIKTAKSLHKKGLIYTNDSVKLEIEPNYQVIASIVEDLNLCMGEEQYELIKNDEAAIIYELALLNFNEDELISDADAHFMENIIRGYVDVSEPVLICDTYAFTTKMDKLQEVYEKALLQIQEGKFKNVIF